MAEPVNFTVNVDRKVIEAARKAAAAEGVGLGEVVRSALARLIERARMKGRARKKGTRGGRF
jgi:hypothetical protein